jgi:hypothetical protein
MKQALTIGLVMAVLAASLSFVAASSIKRVSNNEPLTDADALPAYEILTVARSMGFKPLSEPSRRGPYYVFQAVDQRGQEVRVVADARFGDIVSVAPISPLNVANTPNYQRGARIIHVPQPGERDERASVNERDEPALSPKDDEEEAAPPPRRRTAAPPRLTPRTTPRWAPQRTEQSPPPQRRSDAPPPPSPPPGPRRAVLSAPPPPAEGPTPIRPTPRFNAKADSGEKFQQPATPDAPPPPSGYSPPAALPQGG